jgi:hypothetical protein
MQCLRLACSEREPGRADVAVRLCVSERMHATFEHAVYVIECAIQGLHVRATARSSRAGPRDPSHQAQRICCDVSNEIVAFVAEHYLRLRHSHRPHAARTAPVKHVQWAMAAYITGGEYGNSHHNVQSLGRGPRCRDGTLQAMASSTRRRIAWVEALSTSLPVPTGWWA